MFGKIRDTLVEPFVNDTSSASSIVSNIGDTIFEILKFVAIRKYTIEGIENIPRDRSFLLVANHPGPLDYFPIKRALDEIGVGIHFLAHKNLLTHPLSRSFSLREGLIGVRRFNYDETAKIPGANKSNISGLRKAIRILNEGGNIGIFISGQGYIEDMKKIFKGYRFLLSKTSGEEVLVVPVTIVGSSIRIGEAIVPTNDERFYRELEEGMISQIEK